MYEIFLWLLILSLCLSVQVWDQGYASRGGERPGEPEGQSRLSQFQAKTLQHAGVLWPHRSRHQRHAALLPLPRHRVQTGGLQSGMFGYLMMIKEQVFFFKVRYFSYCQNCHKFYKKTKEWTENDLIWPTNRQSFLCAKDLHYCPKSQ